ncbi:MAG TPA: hypothetical protein VIN38_01895 [Thiobacillus sp.]
MPLSFPRWRFSPRPIAHYALVLSLILITALAWLAVAVLYDTAHLKEEVALSDEKLARQELDEAIVLLTEHAYRTAQAMMAWDEARQQLEDPIYYGYWRHSRALAAGVIPDTLAAVDLYDLNGHSLSTVSSKEASMPDSIRPQNIQPFMKREGEHGYVYYFFPFYRSPDQVHLLGYMGFKFDLQQELHQLRKFRYLDLSSVDIGVNEDRSVPLHELVSRLAFQTIANPETRALEKIISRSFYEIVAIIVLISLLAYLAIVSVITKPLRHLSSHIDDMRRGKGILNRPGFRGGHLV